MKITKKIGWQKCESALEDQLASPLFQEIMKSAAEKIISTEETPDQDTNDFAEYENAVDEEGTFILPVPISDELANEISMLSNYDCWIGHTNFDITPSVKKVLNKIGGIEVLKVLSRYRFFIGVGKMFEFKNVREHIENSINKKEDYESKDRDKD